MLEFVVRGFWGCRQESTAALAGRWAALLEGLRRIDAQTFAAWRVAASTYSVAAEAKTDAEWLAEYITASTSDPDAAREGYVASLSQQPGRPTASVQISAGGTSRRVADSVVVQMSCEESLRTSVNGHLAAALLSLAQTWDVDWGDSYEAEQFSEVKRLLELRVTDPRCGRVGYLSANRAALVPDGLPGVHARTEHGGLLMDLTRSGAHVPDTETIIEVNRSLRAAGAVEKLPAPFDRAKW